MGARRFDELRLGIQEFKGSEGRLSSALVSWIYRTWRAWKRVCSAELCLRVMFVSCPVVSDPLQPHGLQPTRLLCPRNSLGKNSGAGCHFLLQGIFSTQGSNLGLLHSRWILYHLNHQESPVCCHIIWSSYESWDELWASSTYRWEMPLWQGLESPVKRKTGATKTTNTFFFPLRESSLLGERNLYTNNKSTRSV